MTIGEDPDQGAAAGDAALVTAVGLSKSYEGRRGLVDSVLGNPAPAIRALDGVDLSISRGEVLGVIGESGCGKSTLGSTLVRLLDPSAGRIFFEGKDVTHIKGRDLTLFRRQAQLIFQDPFGSLNPRLSVAQLVEEPLVVHGLGDTKARARTVIETLDRVLLPPAEFLHRYPEELSGGQRQRVAIARSIVLGPRLLVADEPVSMLDVSVQAGVLELLRQLAKDGLAVLYVSHDVATVRSICSRVAVMYLGTVVEEGPVEEILDQPRHPYTQKLIAAVPRLEAGKRRDRVSLRGDVPKPDQLPPGCRFNTRCEFARETCAEERPKLETIGRGRSVACHYWREIPEAVKRPQHAVTDPPEHA